MGRLEGIGSTRGRMEGVARTGGRMEGGGMGGHVLHVLGEEERQQSHLGNPAPCPTQATLQRARVQAQHWIGTHHLSAQHPIHHKARPGWRANRQQAK